MIKKIKILTLLVAFISFGFDIAKGSNLPSSKNRILSIERDTITGNDTIIAFIKAYDSIKYTGNFNYSVPQGWQIYLISGPTIGQWLVPDDSIVFKYRLTYPTDSIPYYPQTINITQNVVEKLSGDTLLIKFNGQIFFTPWNTIETWDEWSFYRCNRLWKDPLDEPNAQRVYIPKSSVPISNVNPSDTLTAEWQQELGAVTISNLPFYVKMNALHPDTIAYYSEHFGDSTKNQGDNINQIAISLQYTGTITGRLVARTINDLGANVDIPLSGVDVALVDQDYGGAILEEISRTRTQNDGFFSFTYSSTQPFEFGSLELMLKVFAKNDYYNFGVFRPILDDLDMRIPLLDRVEFDLIDIPNVGKDAGTINEGTLTVHNRGVWVTHWVANAFKYAEDQGVPVASNAKGLKVLLEASGSFFLPNTIWKVSNVVGALNLFEPTIRLESFDEQFENTIYHEWGHYYMWALQGKSFIIPYSDDGSFNHSWDEENHTRICWTEGFANAIMMILDGRFNREDNEYGTERVPRTNGVSVTGGFFFERRLPNAIITNGYRSEYFLACAIYDLWDGAENMNLPNTITTLPGDNTMHPFSDRLLNGTGGNWPEPDNVQFTFQQIMQPISATSGALTSKIKNVYEYIQALLNYHKDDCHKLSNIVKCFRNNEVVLNTEANNSGASSDNIYSEVIFEDRGKIFNSYPYTDVITIYDNIIPLETFNLIPPFSNGVYSITDDVILEDSRSSNQFTFNYNTLNSNFNLNMYTCDGADLTINTWNFIMGNGNNSNTLVINNSSNFTLNSPSVLRINNNSKLIIEQGATLHIFPGSRIILNGDNAILEIKGNLNVHANATFTFEGGSAGSGHVVFNIPQNDNPKDHIILGNNSRIRFVGTGSSDRVMEVMANMEFWPDNNQINPVTNNPVTVNSSFEVQDGLIELGHNAILNIGTAINLSHARLYAEPCCPAKGLVLWGQKNSFSFVTMENVTGGIESHNTVGGHPLLMSVVKVSGADRALLSEGKGSIIGAFESDDNPLGIQIAGSDWPNTFTTPNIHGATSFGTLYTGSPASNLWIKRANYTDNLAGIDFTGKGSLILSCGKFWNVSGASTPNNGITQRGGGNLVAADALGYGAGRISFKDNKNSIVLTKTQPYINDGYNDLSYISSSSGIRMALRGSIALKPKPSMGYTINASNNLWDGTQNPITLCSGTGSYQNYNLTYKRTPASSPACITIPDLAITLSQINTAQSARCASTSGAGTAGTGSDKGTLGTGMVINTTHFTNTNLQDAVGTVLDAMYDTTSQNFEEIITLWTELLTEPTYLTPYNEEDYFYIDLAENKMMEALGMMLIKDTTLELSQGGGGQSIFETVIDAQDAWITTLENDTAAFSVSLKNIFNFDKGAVYHLSGDNPSAATLWSDMQSWASDDYMDHTDYWLCQIVREEALKNCGNNPDSLANIQECQYSEGENAFRLSDTYGNSKEKLPQIQQLKKEIKISKHLNLYPNPASTTVTAELETSQKGEASINIYSADGKHIKTLPSIRLNLGINKLVIPVSDLTTGVYTIAIETRNIKWNEKVVIE